MAALESCPKHNMVAYLEKTNGNAEFHEIIDFLTRSSIQYALTVSPVVSTMFVEQFWMTAKSKTITNVRYITATVVGKPVLISKASIKSDLQFNDAAGIDVLPNQDIFDTIQLMGYEGDLNTLTFNKGIFSSQWKFLFHTIIHCLSSKSTSWDQIPNNIATAVICLATNQVYNFSKLIFDGMMRHLDAKKKFVIYPRNVTPLFPSMLAQPTEDEGAVSERPSETQPIPSPTYPSEDQSEPQPDPFLIPSSSNPIPDSLPEGSGGNHGGQSSSDRSLSGNEDDLTLQSVYDRCVSLCKQVTIQAKQIQDFKAQIKKLKKKGRKIFKSKPTVHKDPAFYDLDDAMDYMETEDAHDEGTVKKQESILTLKPLPKIDPKDKGNKVLEEKAESEGVNEVKKKFKMLANDEEIARKVQEEWEAEKEKKKLAEEEATKAAFTNEYEFIQARLNADKILAEKLQEEEREKFTIEQRAKFLYDTIAAQRRFLA
ncbi:hypothetical protein Tco_0681525 [Tanacetum coccineum]|uniref:Synaptobrevin, longin-like domain protein n=1 Tax=Tanacetum coccineum TaxID=301880 RepID=A0ABQ4XQ66_9ASTR